MELNKDLIIFEDEYYYYTFNNKCLNLPNLSDEEYDMIFNYITNLYELGLAKPNPSRKIDNNVQKGTGL